MTAHAINDSGCVPDGDCCLLHGAELICSHRCISGTGPHDCDDPYPEPRPAGHHDGRCIVCGEQITWGELVTDWEEGAAHVRECGTKDGGRWT